MSAVRGEAMAPAQRRRRRGDARAAARVMKVGGSGGAFILVRRVRLHAVAYVRERVLRADAKRRPP